MANNEEIKRELKKMRIYQYEVAELVGVTEITLCKWLRYPLPPEKEKRVLDAIERLKRGAAAS